MRFQLKSARSNRKAKMGRKGTATSNVSCVMLLLGIVALIAFIFGFMHIKDVQHNQTSEKISQLDSFQNSNFAYVTLISGIDESMAYRGFLYNALIMKLALHKLGSKADFIAMIGYSSNVTDRFETDIDLLRQHRIIIYTLPRLLTSQHGLSFAEMALLKITPYSFTQYSRVQFLDGDVMPTLNMDCFFQLDKNSFTVGAVSPLNSGWYLAIPDLETYEYMRRKAIWRLGRDWDIINGWVENDSQTNKFLRSSGNNPEESNDNRGEPMPNGLTYRGGKPCKEWLFNGADMDQGLFTHTFIINQGNALLMDTELKRARVFIKGLKYEPDTTIPMEKALLCCNGLLPTSHFAHFTGKTKPWLMLNLSDIKSNGKNNNLMIWKDHLDSLKLDINCSTVYKLRLSPPLGYFNANFPKGGYKLK